jgi:hypothetical protein
LASSNDHEEIAMNRIHSIRHAIGILAGLAGALLASAAVFTGASPAAFATHVPPPGDYGGTVQAPPQVHTIVTGGMPGWQITLIAVAAAVIAAAAAVIVDLAWAARRHLTAPTA